MGKGKNNSTPWVCGIAVLTVLLSLCSSPARAQYLYDRVVTLTLDRSPASCAVPAPGIVTQDYILKEVPGASGIIVLFPGGYGSMNLDAANSQFGINNSSNFLVRSRNLFASYGFHVAVVDAASDFLTCPYRLMGQRRSAEHRSDMESIISDLRLKFPGLPVWVIGTSMGTISAAQAATIPPTTPGSPNGLILTSSVTQLASETTLDVPLESIGVPTLIVSHEDDSCMYSPPGDDKLIASRLGSAPRVGIRKLSGGLTPISSECDALSYHGYFGIEAETVSQIMNWISPRSTKNDFDGDGRSDIGCYYPDGGNWYEFRSTDGFWQTQFGYAGTLPITGDFDGDGKSDVGCYHPPSGNWYMMKSTEGFSTFQFGYDGTIPIVGDFDGDGKDDVGCYHPPSGNWYMTKSTEGFSTFQFGYDGTIPIVGDFDGDGKDDFGYYYAPGGNWSMTKSTEGLATSQFGYGGTIPIVGDFDGDGKDDIGCYDPAGGNWYVIKSTEGFWTTQFGYVGTEPVVGDFDGDGKSDLGCYYPDGGNWYVLKSTEGFWQTQFGYEGTIPLGGTLR